MVIVWRGAGIAIPIIILISGWLTGYAFEEPKLGNGTFMAWTLLWAGIVITLMGIGAFPWKKDENTGKYVYVGNHDLFWIPMIFWGLGCLTFSINYFNKSDESSLSYEDNLEELQESNEVESETVTVDLSNYEKNDKNIKRGERILKFYNPTKKTITLGVEDEEGNTIVEEGEVPANGTTFLVLKAGTYLIKYDDQQELISFRASKTTTNYNSDIVWFILGKQTDFLLVDATETCHKEISTPTFKSYDWATKILDRYDGKSLIHMTVERKDDTYFTIKEPHYRTPLSLEYFERIYCIIPIPATEKATDTYIEEFLLAICFESEGTVFF